MRSVSTAFNNLLTSRGTSPFILLDGSHASVGRRSSRNTVTYAGNSYTAAAINYGGMDAIGCGFFQCRLNLLNTGNQAAQMFLAQEILGTTASLHLSYAAPGVALTADNTLTLISSGTFEDVLEIQPDRISVVLSTVDHRRLVTPRRMLGPPTFNWTRPAGASFVHSGETYIIE